MEVYNINMGIRERVLKNETKRFAGKFVSDEKAHKFANLIFEDGSEDKKEQIPINGNEPEPNTEEDGILSKIDSWLDKAEKKAEEKAEETPDPVDGLDSMEQRIEELEDE